MSDGLPHATANQSTTSFAHRLALGWLLGPLGALVVLLAFGGEPLQLAFRYERDPILAGEYWRLITGHLVHGTLAHLLLNVAGIGLIAALFPRDYSLGQWVLILVFSLAAIDVGFVFYEPQLQWYVGLSGVLHGFLAAGAIAWWRHETRVLALILSVIFVAKLVWEQLQGALPFSGDMPVIVDAHFYGALGGALAATLIWIVRHRARHWPWRRRSL